MNTLTAAVLPNNVILIKKEFVIEIELNGKVKFNDLLNSIYMEMGICYKVLSAKIEYSNGADFGSFQLHIVANSEEYKRLEFFLNKNKLLNTTVEYRCRKYF